MSFHFLPRPADLWTSARRCSYLYLAASGLSFSMLPPWESLPCPPHTGVLQSLLPKHLFELGMEESCGPLGNGEMMFSLCCSGP